MLSLVFPASCWVSGEAISENEFGLGEVARERLARSVLWPYCALCGATMGQGARRGGVAWDMEKPCGECERRDLGVGRIVRVGTFEEPLAKLVHVMKFGRRWELARVVAPYLYQALVRGTNEGKWPKVDLLVPVAHCIGGGSGGGGLINRRSWAREVGKVGRVAGEKCADARVGDAGAESDTDGIAAEGEFARSVCVCGGGGGGGWEACVVGG